MSGRNIENTSVSYPLQSSELFYNPQVPYSDPHSYELTDAGALVQGLASRFSHLNAVPEKGKGPSEEVKNDLRTAISQDIAQLGLAHVPPEEIVSQWKGLSSARHEEKRAELPVAARTVSSETVVFDARVNSTA
jgi:hypothetical protein